MRERMYYVYLNIRGKSKKVRIVFKSYLRINTIFLSYLIVAYAVKNLFSQHIPFVCLHVSLTHREISSGMLMHSDFFLSLSSSKFLSSFKFLKISIVHLLNNWFEMVSQKQIQGCDVWWHRWSFNRTNSTNLFTPMMGEFCLSLYIRPRQILFERLSFQIWSGELKHTCVCICFILPDSCPNSPSSVFRCTELEKSLSCLILNHSIYYNHRLKVIGVEFGTTRQFKIPS